MSQPSGPGHDPDPDAEVLEAEVSVAYRAHAPALFRAAYRLTLDPGAAEDAVQEAFLDAVRHWPSVRRNPARLSTLLYGSVYKRAIDDYRRRTGSRNKSRPVRVYLADPLPERPDPRHDEDTVVAGITAEIYWKKIVAATAHNPRTALVAWLRWNQQWTEQQIADELDVSRTTVQRDLRHVQDAAREQITAYSSTPGNLGGEE